MRKALGVSVALLLALAGEAAGLERCEPAQTTFDRMIGRATAPPPELIADAFILQGPLAGRAEVLTRFWIDNGGEPGDLAPLIAAWPVGSADRAAVAEEEALLETLRAIRHFVVAFEGPPPAAEEAAERLSARLPAAMMSRDAYRAEFLAETRRIAERRGVSTYAAVLMAAQVMRNRLDELQGVPAGALPAADDAYQMRLWDQSIRQEPLRPEIERLRELPNGAALVNDYLIERPTVIGCAAAAMAAGGPPVPPEPPPRIPGFSTVGYSNPALLDAIFQGQLEDIELAAVAHYLAAFTGMFTRSDLAECRQVVSTATAARITAAGMAEIWARLLGGLREPHRDRGGSRDDLFEQGFAAGAGTFGGMALTEAGAEADARLFYYQHGCDGFVPERFFGQVSELAWQK